MPKRDVTLEDVLLHEHEQANLCTICRKPSHTLTVMYFGLRTVRACPECRTKLTGVRDERKRK